LTRTEVVAIVALAVSLAATPAAAAAATRLGVVDRPGPLKPQSRDVPYLGGIGVLAGLLTGAAVARPLLIVPLVAATALGTADDVADLKPWIRLAGQTGIGIVVAVVIPTRLDRPVGFVLVTLVTVLLINGTNLIDGLDALAAGVAAVAGGGLALVLHGDPRLFACCLAVAALGFLLYNRPPARVYLGDGGAYLIGTALTILLAWAWARGVRPEVGVSSLLIVAVPAAEVVLAIARRARSRSPMAVGDRDHPYDLLVRHGWPGPAATAAYVAAELGLALTAVLVSRTGGVSTPAIAVATVAAILALVALRTLVRTPRPSSQDS
jgi:UDP-GlcNAc:undecaprenyl-phosphate GlcNAc-1-phosphate transferase